MVQAGRAVVLAVLAVSASAAADTFGGFSGIDSPYLVDQDRVCQPLEIVAGAASGEPACAKATTDRLAQLSIKPPLVQRGSKAVFAATATGRQLAVARSDGAPVVTWTAADPIGKIVEVYASEHEDRVAVAYTVRRFGKEVTALVGFVVVKTMGTTPNPNPNPNPNPSPTPTPAPIPEDPALTKALASARSAPKQKALAAWRAVLTVDADHSEARFRIATLQASAKESADAIKTLDDLAKSKRADAIEWLVEARFDPAFAAVRADPKYRASVGLDRPPGSTFERFMGFGGQWEQVATCGENPEVHLIAKRDRTFKLTVAVHCNGQGFDLTKKGTWRVDGANLVLVVPTHGEATTAKDESKCIFEKAGGEDALRCDLGHDLDFVVLPARR